MYVTVIVHIYARWNWKQVSKIEVPIRTEYTKKMNKYKK